MATRDSADAVTRRSSSPAAAAAAGLVLLAGCSNPLAPDPSDYGRRLAPERFQQVERLKVEEYAKPTEPAPPSAPGLPASVQSRFAGMTTMELSIEQARASALEHNLDLRVALVDPRISGQALAAEEARFEAVFTPRVSYAVQDDPTFNTTTPTQQNALSADAGVSIPLRTGGRVTVDLNESRTETGNPFVTLNPAYSAATTFSISQPLLRNAGRWVATYPIRLASYQEQQARARTKLEVIRQLAAVDRAYWRLYEARKDLEVRQRQYELAAALLEKAHRRVAAGDRPELEELSAASGVAQQLEAIIVAENDVLTQQRELKRIVNLPGLTVDTTVMLVPTSPPDPVAYRFKTAELMEVALGTRMEMLQLEFQLAADAATIEFNRNQTLPLVSVDSSYRIAGLGPTFNGGNRVMWDNRFDSWSVGVSAEVPIGNEAARANLQRAILTRLQRLSSKDALELSIRQEVLNAVDGVEAGWQRILAARQAVLAAARAFQAEQRQNDVGTRTATDVLNAQSRLAEAQTSEIRALADYQIALVDLAFATGTLLGAARVDWEPPAGADPAAVEKAADQPVLIDGTPPDSP